MADSAALLRMLEPTVRPISTPTHGGAKSPQHPVEKRSFDSLLEEAGHDMPNTTSPEALSGADESEADGGTSFQASGPSSPLDQLSHVENASLRELIARSHAVSDEQSL